MPDTKTKPPVFIRGGKRLNFSREDEWETGQINVHIDYARDAETDASTSKRSTENP